MVLIRRESAQISARYLLSGVLELRYSGVFSESSADELSSHARRATRDEPCVVVRMDSVLMAVTKVPLPTDAAARGGVYPPCALVVGDEGRQIWMDYCREVGRLGLMRVVFSSSQLELARRWCANVARSTPPRSPQSRRCGLLLAQ